MSSLFGSILRHAVLESACRVWVPLDETGKPVLDPAIVSALGEIPWDAVHLPELAPLADTHAAMLVRDDGYVFQLLLVRRTKKPDFRPPLQLEDLVTLGAKFPPRTGTINGAKMPVNVGLVEIHRDVLARDIELQLAPYERRGVMSPKVAVGVSVIEETTGRVVSNGPAIGRWRAKARWKRVWERRGVSSRAMADALASARFDVARTTVGLAIGAALAVGSFLGLAAMGAQNGLLYGGALTVGPVIGAAIACTGPGIRRHALAQALAAGIGAWAFATAAWWTMGNAMTFDILVIGGVVGMVSAAAGQTGNTVAS